MGYILVDGLVTGKRLKFYLKNMHFHTPSEHAFDSIKHSIEGHFVHSLDEGETTLKSDSDEPLNKLVFGIMFNCKSDHANAFLASLKINQLNTATKVYLKSFMEIVVGKEAFHYEGSLTTPNCDEAVNWFVMRRVQGCSIAQEKDFTTVENNNYRNVKSVNQRRIFDIKLG